MTKKKKQRRKRIPSLEELVHVEVTTHLTGDGSLHRLLDLLNEISVEYKLNVVSRR